MSLVKEAAKDVIKYPCLVGFPQIILFSRD